MGSGAELVNETWAILSAFPVDGKLDDFVTIYCGVPTKMVPAFADCGTACLG